MADVGFLIDIAAEMPSGEPTIAQLDRLTAELIGAGATADQFHDAIANVSNTLDAAKVASQAANAALASGAEEYRRLELAALQASKAAEKAALKNGGIIPFDLSARAAETAMAVDHYADTLRDLERGARGAKQEEDRLAQTLRNVQRLSNETARAQAAQAKAHAEAERAAAAAAREQQQGFRDAQELAGVGKFRKLGEALGSARGVALLAAAGIAALVAAVVALTAAAVAGAVALGAWGVKLADAARSSGLAREAFEAMHPELAGLRGEFKALAGETGLGDAALRGLAKSLRDAKVSAEDRPAALRAAALAEAALGQGGASEFIAEIKKADGAVGDLANDVQRKLGGVVAKQMRGLDAQAARMKKNLGATFGGLNIDPLLDGLERLVGLFDKNTAAGQAMAFLFESVFQPIINQADRAAIAVEAFALGFLIGLVKLYIAIKPAIAAVSEFFGFEDDALLGVLTSAKDLGELAAYAFTALAVVFGVSMGALVALTAALTAAGTSIMAFAALAGHLTAEAGKLGGDLVLGLARGIMNAAGAVVNAITGVVRNAIATAKSLLGIASPSRVFASIGEFTGEGFVEGVEGMQGDARDAMAGLVAAPGSSPLAAQAGLAPAVSLAAASSAPGAGGAAPGARSGANVTGNTFIFNGVANAQDALDRMGEALTRILEGDAAQVGAEAPAT